MRGTVICDLDGTLVDSASDLADALDVLLAEHGLDPVGIEGTRKLIGHGIANLVRRGFEVRGHGLVKADRDAAIARFRDLYAERLPARTVVYPGVQGALDRLQAEGWRLVVCTNKLEAFSRTILDSLGLLGYFALVAGPDTFDVAKPDPQHLLRTLPVDRRPDYTAIMVGDSEVDIEVAKSAGLPVIAVTYGYSQTPLATLAPHALVDSFSEVPDHVARIAALQNAKRHPVKMKAAS